MAQPRRGPVDVAQQPQQDGERHVEEADVLERHLDVGRVQRLQRVEHHDHGERDLHVAQPAAHGPLGDVERVRAGPGAQPAEGLGERAGGDHAVERDQQARGLAAERDRHPERQRAEGQQPEQRRAPEHQRREDPERDQRRRRAAREHGRAAGELVAGERRDGERREAERGDHRGRPLARVGGEQHDGRGGRRGEHAAPWRTGATARTTNTAGTLPGGGLPLSSPRDDRRPPLRARRGDHRGRRGPARPGLRAVVPQLRRALRAAVGARPGHGHAPQYTADFAPTPHPLQTAFGLLALPFGDASDDVLTFATLLCFGALVYLAFALGAGAVLAVGRPRGRAGRAHAARAGARRAARLPGRAVRDAGRRRGAARGAAPKRGLAGAGAARRRGPAAAGGVGALRPLRPVDLDRERQPPARPRRRADRVRAADLGGFGLGGHRRPAALAARHRRPRDRQRPPPLRLGRPVLDRAVLRLRPARAARGRHPDRARLRLVPRSPPRGAAARRRGGDGGRVRRRPDLRAAADRPLRRARRRCC